MKLKQFFSIVKQTVFNFVRVLPMVVFTILVFVADQKNISTVDIFILLLVMYISIIESLYRGVLRDTGLLGSYLTLGIAFFIFGSLLAVPGNPWWHIWTYLGFCSLMTGVLAINLRGKSRLLLVFPLLYTLGVSMHLTGCLLKGIAILEHDSPWIWILQSGSILQEMVLGFEDYPGVELPGSSQIVYGLVLVALVVVWIYRRIHDNQSLLEIGILVFGCTVGVGYITSDIIWCAPPDSGSTSTWLESAAELFRFRGSSNVVNRTGGITNLPSKIEQTSTSVQLACDDARTGVKVISVSAAAASLDKYVSWIANKIEEM